MAFQTNVFRDGEWRTETVHISTILQKSAATPAAPTPVLPEAPACGILTRTLVQSPLVHWILPTHLRSARYNDVAFVGDHYVQINELGDGGELRKVLRKDDFGARIQNAHVIGNTFERLEAGDSEVAFGQLKEEDDEAQMDANLGLRPSPSSHAALPPHLLLLVLANGTLVFLFVRRLGERFEFVTSEFRHPDARLGTLGYHVAVDPKSRYIAVADMENTFVVYELQSWETMSQQYSQHSSISPVKSWSPRPVNGLVHKMEFLHPRPEDDYHVILLLVILKHGASAPKMILYDWERGDDVRQILAEDKDGHRLPREHRMPLFLIPLTIRNSFFIVSENSLAVCKDPLQGPPQYVTVDAGAHPKTRFHYGTQPPMWTAWDRPVRRRGYYDNKDNIYLAREDGVIVFFEFDTIDLLATGMNVGNCNSNISTAFTTMYDAFSDVAIISGDSGPGMVCQLRPRKPIVELGIIPNWSPTLDFVTTDQSTSWRGDAGQRGAQTSRWSEQYRDQAARHDRIFCVSGTGIQGSITELRQGISANIGWEIAYDTAIRQAWVFEAQLNDIGPGYYLLLALPDSSDILQVPRDSLEASRPNPGGPDFDTTARTLAAAQCSEQIIAQVTESAISLITPLQSSRQPFSSFEGVQGNAEHATTLSCLVVAMKVGPGQTTIAFVDPDTGENLSMPTDKDSNPLPFINGLGLLDDRIHDMFEWLYVKEGKTWLFIVITTRDGQLLIITTQRVEVEDADGRVSEKIRHWTRYKKKVADQAIYAGVGDGADLFFCAGNILHWEALDLVEKKLKPKKTFALPSPATSLRIVNDQLCALTTNHSLLVLNHKAEGRHDEMTFAHSDVGSRKASHYIEMGNSCEETPAWPITLISEQTHDFVGVWVPWKEPEKEFRIVFKGRLPAGVRRLRRGHVRPAWMAPNNMPRYGHIPSTVDAADVLAICMDGSLHHFTLLSPEALVVLELIQKLAVQGRSDDSPTARLSHANGTEPPAMAKARRHGHVDGNVLQRCLDKRALEALLSAGDGADVLLRDALENLEGGRWTASFGGQREKYVDLAYEILEYFLAPVF
ncbi:hypothetical protein VD0002_g10087 [Verticillium dahliae]|nr:hypothetical protein VdG1_07551 [Verticillium dahliae VDG1]PNH53375.1 hypothetical protein VD0002_g10087 [Verticillium dahliae]